MVPVTFVLPSFPQHAIGGYKIAYSYANKLADFGFDVSVRHVRFASDVRSRRGRDLGIAAAYKIGSRKRPSWFALDRRVNVRNLSSPEEIMLPDSSIVVATAVSTARLVEPYLSPSLRGVYLIQHFEDFAAPADEVFATWDIPMRRVVVSRWLEKLVTSHGAGATLVQNGVDFELFSPGKPVLDRAPSVLAMVSSDSFKRTDLICDCFEILASSRPELTLKTFGAIPRPPGLPGSVKHWQSPKAVKLSNLYASSQVFLCASDFEGFGLPALEAMASGSVVVSTENGGVESFGMRSAVFVPRGDAVRLSQAALDTLDNPALLEQLSKAGLEVATQLDQAAQAEAFSRVIIEESGLLERV